MKNILKKEQNSSEENIEKSKDNQSMKNDMEIKPVASRSVISNIPRKNLGFYLNKFLFLWSSNHSF